MGARAPVKYHYSYRFFTYSVKRSRDLQAGPSFLACEAPIGRSSRPVARPRKGLRRQRAAGRARSALKTVSGGEFDWGGTSVKR